MFWSLQVVVRILIDKEDNILKNFEQDIQKAGFDCWKTQIGGKGVTFHHGLFNKDIKLPKSFNVA